MFFNLIFLGTEYYGEEVEQKMIKLIGLMEKTWKHCHAWLDSKKLLELP